MIVLLLVHQPDRNFDRAHGQSLLTSAKLELLVGLLVLELGLGLLWKCLLDESKLVHRDDGGGTAGVDEHLEDLPLLVLLVTACIKHFLADRFKVKVRIVNMRGARVRVSDDIINGLTCERCST